MVVITWSQGHNFSLCSLRRNLVLLNLELLLLLVLLDLVLGLLEGICYRLLRLDERMLDLLSFHLVAKLMPTCQRYIILMIAILRSIVLYELRINVANLFLRFVRITHLLLIVHLVIRLVELATVDSLACKEAQRLCFTIAFVKSLWVEAFRDGGQVSKGGLEAALLH